MKYKKAPLYIAEHKNSNFSATAVALVARNLRGALPHSKGISR